MARSCPSPLSLPSRPGRYLDSELRQAAALEGPDQALHAVDGPGNLGGGRRGQLHLGVVPERGQARLRVRHGGCGEGDRSGRCFPNGGSPRGLPGPSPAALSPVPQPLPSARPVLTPLSSVHSIPTPFPPTLVPRSPVPLPVPHPRSTPAHAARAAARAPVRPWPSLRALNVTASRRTRRSPRAARNEDPGLRTRGGARRGGVGPDPRVRDPRSAETTPVPASSPKRLFYNSRHCHTSTTSSKIISMFNFQCPPFPTLIGEVNSATPLTHKSWQNVPLLLISPCHSGNGWQHYFHQVKHGYSLNTEQRETFGVAGKESGQHKEQVIEGQGTTS